MVRFSMMKEWKLRSRINLKETVMKKMIKYTILWIVGLLLFSACYDDKGSYDYHDINEVAITLPASMGVRLPKVDSVLVEIIPELEQTLAENESNLVFLWERKLEQEMLGEWKVCGHEKICRIYIKPENTENITLRLTLKDNTEETVWYKEVVLKMIQPYSNTWFVLQDEGGKAVLGAVDGECESGVVIRDAYREDTGKELAIKGVPGCLAGNYQYGSPLYFFPSSMGFNTVMQRAIIVLTDQEMDVLEASTFERVWSLEEMLMQDGITFSPGYVFSRDGDIGGEMLINDGKMYCANMDGYSIYNSVQVGGESYRTEIGGYMNGRFFVYDEENHRFLNLPIGHNDGMERYTNRYIRTSGRQFVDSPLSLEFVGENEESDKTKNVFDPDHVDPALKMIGMSEMSGGKQMLAFALRFADREVHVFEFSLAGWESSNKDHARCSGKYEIPLPAEAGEDVCFIASQGFARIFFMGCGNKIYKIDLNRMTPKISVIYEHDDANVKVTNLKFKHYFNPYDWDNDSYIPYAQTLGAVLDYGGNQGGIVVMELNTAGDVNRDINGVFEYKGFGKIVDLAYTFKSN